jgi:hypothetical protein
VVLICRLAMSDCCCCDVWANVGVWRYCLWPGGVIGTLVVLCVGRNVLWDASCIARWAKCVVLRGVVGLNVDLVVFWMDLGMTATLLVSRLAANVAWLG